MKTPKQLANVSSGRLMVKTLREPISMVAIPAPIRVLPTKAMVYVSATAKTTAPYGTYNTADGNDESGGLYRPA